MSSRITCTDAHIHAQCELTQEKDRVLKCNDKQAKGLSVLIEMCLTPGGLVNDGRTPQFHLIVRSSI